MQYDLATILGCMGPVKVTTICEIISVVFWQKNSIQGWGHGKVLNNKQQSSIYMYSLCVCIV